ncbi:MAG: TetR/AcrR family transcriptional regulator [Ruminococcaceae bacterium]|nr:TetR/AcrR family transcriptional regulator [Oscillospiraceae bacterium]
MYKLCKTEQSAQRQRKLEEGLLNAMKTKRYEEITISDLCEQMEIPRKSFYRYFSSKDGALYALVDHTLLDFEQHTGILSGNAIGDAHQDLRHFFEFWYEQKPLLDALERSGLSGVLVHRAISQAQNEYVLPRYPTPPEVRAMQHHAITFAICGLMSMMTRWHRSGYVESAAQMAQIAATLLTRPLIQA